MGLGLRCEVRRRKGQVMEQLQGQGVEMSSQV